MGRDEAVALPAYGFDFGPTVAVDICQQGSVSAVGELGKKAEGSM